ncbi:hypothetical protein ABZV80_30355 [Streptomyces sp. NPDC005132]|uniref:hypothetical protein n=1 Tax=Streptomyces sp. NPDC005132 TaxID=3154294 RepID=UPI0033AD423A
MKHSWKGAAVNRGDADGCHACAAAAAVKERDGRAFAEVQRADSKATTVCGVAGGLLALSATALSQRTNVSGVTAAMLSIECHLLVAAVGVALLALRPVLPRGGLRGELASLYGQHGCDSSAGSSLTDGNSRRGGEELRLRALSQLADRKLRLVRLAGDLVLVALPVAGMGLLSSYTFN